MESSGVCTVLIKEKIWETDDCVSLLLEVSSENLHLFEYHAGQYLIVGIPSINGDVVARCYSLSGAYRGGLYRITVKRVEGGCGSNWILDKTRPGDSLKVLSPRGNFVLKSPHDSILLFAAGSGITPLMAIATDILEEGTGEVVLFYVNTKPGSIIFKDELDALRLKHKARFTIIYWLNSVVGRVNQEYIENIFNQFSNYTIYACGPAPFLELVIQAANNIGVSRSELYIENFFSLNYDPFIVDRECKAGVAPLTVPKESACEINIEAKKNIQVEVELNGEKHIFDDWDGKSVLLDFLESKRLDVPFVCREGHCGSCVCTILEGEISMKINNALDCGDIEAGLILTCQALPATEKLRIAY